MSLGMTKIKRETHGERPSWSASIPMGGGFRPLVTTEHLPRVSLRHNPKVPSSVSGTAFVTTRMWL